MRRWLATTGILLGACACAPAQQPDDLGPLLTAVYTLADHHTSRWTSEQDPLVKIRGVCQITSGVPNPTLNCAPPDSARRTGRRYYYDIVLFRDLAEALYVAACSDTASRGACSELRAGQTFSAEVEGNTIRIVKRGEQVSMRILETRPRPVTIDSPTRGTPSNVKPSAGAPSKVPYSEVPPSRGAPSDVLPSDVSIAAGAPSVGAPSQISNPVVSPEGGRLHVYCSNGAAQVYVDNHLIGRPPAEAPVLPGRHTVMVRALGFRDWTRTVQVPPGETIRVTAELRR